MTYKYLRSARIARDPQYAIPCPVDSCRAATGHDCRQPDGSPFPRPGTIHEARTRAAHNTP